LKSCWTTAIGNPGLALSRTRCSTSRARSCCRNSQNNSQAMSCRDQSRHRQLDHAVLFRAGSLLSDVALMRWASLRWSRTKSNSLRKSARRSRLCCLVAIAKSATMSFQQRTGLALLSNMNPKSNFANIIPRPRCQLSGTEDRALRLPVAPTVLIAGAISRSAKKRHSNFGWK